MAKKKLTRRMVERARELATEFRTDKEIYTCLGISETCFYAYKANEDDPLCVAFSEALKKGHEEYLQRIERECLNRIIEAKEWQSDAWVLERLMPDKYGRLDRLQATLDGNLNSEINITVEE